MRDGRDLIWAFNGLGSILIYNNLLLIESLISQQEEMEENKRPMENEDDTNLNTDNLDEVDEVEDTNSGPGH